MRHLELDKEKRGRQSLRDKENKIFSKLIRSAIEANDKIATIRLGFTEFATLEINVCAIAIPQQFSSNSGISCT